MLVRHRIYPDIQDQAYHILSRDPSLSQQRKECLAFREEPGEGQLWLECVPKGVENYKLFCNITVAVS